MNAEEWLKSIVEEVLKRLQSKMKKATVLFTGGAIGFPESLQQIKRLKDDGWDLNILLSNSAVYTLTPQFIKENSGTGKVYVEKDIKELHPFYQGIGAFIVPTLTLNTAAKIALGIADTMATNLASNIIMQGIPFIAAKDSCDLGNPLRSELGLNKAPKAYLDRMAEHLRALESYGIKLVDAKDLYQAVQMNVLTFSNQKNQAPESSKPIFEYKKKVLTRNDMIDAKQKGAVVKISHTTILSPLALEAAKELGVKIIQE